MIFLRVKRDTNGKSLNLDWLYEGFRDHGKLTTRTRSSNYQKRVDNQIGTDRGSLSFSQLMLMRRGYIHEINTPTTQHHRSSGVSSAWALADFYAGMGRDSRVFWMDKTCIPQHFRERTWYLPGTSGAVILTRCIVTFASFMTIIIWSY